MKLQRAPLRMQMALLRRAYGRGTNKGHQPTSAWVFNNDGCRTITIHGKLPLLVSVHFFQTACYKIKICAPHPLGDLTCLSRWVACRGCVLATWPWRDGRLAELRQASIAPVPRAVPVPARLGAISAPTRRRHWVCRTGDTARPRRATGWEKAGFMCVTWPCI